MSVSSKMTAIANAIRSKTGQSSTIKLTLDDMAAKIKTLSEPFLKEVIKGTTTQSSIVDSDLDVIRPYAFYGVQGISSMEFKNANLTEIGESAFKNCSVKSLKLPSGITSLPKEMFASSSLAYFSAPGVTEVGEGCFKNSKLTETPKLSDNITTIPKNFCHLDTPTLTKMSIPSKCVRIEASAYNDLSSINKGLPDSAVDKQLFVGSSVEYVGSDNFNIYGFYASTSSLTPSTVLNFSKLKTIKSYCFNMWSLPESHIKYYQSGYYNFNFNSLETMGHLNFFKVPFKTITDTLFPKLISFGHGCFTNNTLLTSVNLTKLERIKPITEETVPTVGMDDNYELDDYPIYILEQSPFANCTSLTSITLPALLEFDITLEGCTALTTIDLTAVTRITTFETTSLANLIIRNETPPALNVRTDLGTHINFPETINIYVPDPSLYENLDNWSYYYSLGCIKPLSEYAG